MGDAVRAGVQRGIGQRVGIADQRHRIGGARDLGLERSVHGQAAVVVAGGRVPAVQHLRQFGGRH